jgi:hypothetical protein
VSTTANARCADVLSASTDPPGVKLLRIVERVEGFILQRLDERGEPLGDELFDTLDEAMTHVYSKYEQISDWRFCPDR